MRSDSKRMRGGYSPYRESKLWELKLGTEVGEYCQPTPQHINFEITLNMRCTNVNMALNLKSANLNIALHLSCGNVRLTLHVQDRVGGKAV